MRIGGDPKPTPAAALVVGRLRALLRVSRRFRSLGVSLREAHFTSTGVGRRYPRRGLHVNHPPLHDFLRIMVKELASDLILKSNT